MIPTARSPHRRLLQLVVTCSALASACGGAEPGVASHQSTASTAIQGGTLDSGDPKVGMLYRADTHWCTGTLLTPSIVLTAGHCVDGQSVANLTFYTGNGSYSAFNYNPASDPGMTPHAVTKFAEAPGINLAGCPDTNDLALVQLGDTVNSMVSSYATSAAQLPAVGGVVRAVGFGWNNASDWFGQKYQGNESLVTSSPSWLQLGADPAIADSGDSGGPIYNGTTIVGITMCHNDGTWPGHNKEYYQRVDTLSSWIASTVTSWEQPCYTAVGNDYNSCIADGWPACNCLAWFYSERMMLCGLGGPQIFCKPIF